MSGQPVELFMWGYQDSYRISIQMLMRDVLAELGAEEDATALVVGVLSPDSQNHNPVCIEPEDGKWLLSTFDGLLESVEAAYKNHPMQNLVFSDGPSMRDKPEWMRQSSVCSEIAKALRFFDASHDVRSFCGQAKRVGDYYVTPVIQVSNTIFSQFPPLAPNPNISGQRGYGHRSLIEAAIFAVLHEATEILQRPDPGRSIHQSMRSAEEIVRIAAQDFLHTPGLSIERRYISANLFDTFNLVSSLMYEGVEGIGHLILIDPENEAVDFHIQFADPVPFRESRWVRKVLQMSSSGFGIIADSQRIYGLGQLKDSHDPDMQDAFIISFLDHYHWELRCGQHVLLRSRYAVPALPQEPFDKSAFLANYARLFPQSSSENGLHLWHLLHGQIRLDHGSMIVVAEDAAIEAERLSKQGTKILPVQFSEELLRSVSGIDGTILLDPQGVCHAIGVILDGEANDECTPSRGSRFNSGVRYVCSATRRRLAIVVSDDHTVDLIPPLRRLISRSFLEQHVAAFETATLDSYHEARAWLNAHRFYINADQCKRLNIAVSRLNELPKSVGQLYLSTELFEVHADMDASYLTN